MITVTFCKVSSELIVSIVYLFRVCVWGSFSVDYFIGKLDLLKSWSITVLVSKLKPDLTLGIWNNFII